MDRYVIDTNALVYLNMYTPEDIHPSIWRAVEKLIAEERAIIPRDVLDELGRVEDVLAPWAKGLAGFVQEADDADVGVVAEISESYPGWVSGTQNAADPWVIAHAARMDALIVTNERAKGPGAADHNLRIPNIAVKYDIECVTLNDLGRREGWRF
ncbi:DUF4411 family protein [Prescottella equi]